MSDWPKEDLGDGRMSDVDPDVLYASAQATIERLQAELREAREVMRRARLSLSAAARDFHAQQADDLLFHALAKSETQP